MKEQIAQLQKAQLSDAQKSIQNDYFDGLRLIEQTEKAIVESIASGSRFVKIPGQGTMFRYHSALTFLRTCKENQVDLNVLHLDAFGEPMPERDPRLPAEETPAE